MLLGLTGTHGAGKGSVADYLVKKYGFTHVAISDFLAREVEKRGGVADRPARTALANELRKESPKGLIERASAPYLHREGKFIIETLYTASEVEYIKEQGGLVISVDADIKTRFERIQNRGSAKDNVSYEEFLAEQTKQLVSPDIHSQNLIAATEAADFHILNNGSKADLEKEIDALMGTLD